MAWVMVILNPCNEERASLAYEGRERERGERARGPLFNTYAGNKRNGGELQQNTSYIYTCISVSYSTKAMSLRPGTSLTSLNPGNL